MLPLAKAALPDAIGEHRTDSPSSSSEYQSELPAVYGSLRLSRLSNDLVHVEVHRSPTTFKLAFSEDQHTIDAVSATAAAAGLRCGDRIIAADGVPLGDSALHEVLVPKVRTACHASYT